MFIIDIEGTGRNIKHLRQKAGLSVNDLAGYFPYQSQQAIYNWQQGKNLPTAENMLMLSKLFRTPMEEIYCYEEIPQQADEPKGSSVFLFKYRFNDRQSGLCYTVLC